MKKPPTKITDRKQLADLIRATRLAKEMSPYALAKAASITQGQLGYIEEGNRNSGLDIYIAVINAIGLDLCLTERK